MTDTAAEREVILWSALRGHWSEKCFRNAVFFYHSRMIRHPWLLRPLKGKEKLLIIKEETLKTQKQQILNTKIFYLKVKVVIPHCRNTVTSKRSALKMLLKQCKKYKHQNILKEIISKKLCFDINLLSLSPPAGGCGPSGPKPHAEQLLPQTATGLMNKTRDPHWSPLTPTSQGHYCVRLTHIFSLNCTFLLLIFNILIFYYFITFCLMFNVMHIPCL